MAKSLLVALAISFTVSLVGCQSLFGPADTVTHSILPQVALRGFNPPAEGVCFMIRKADCVYMDLTSNAPPPAVQPEAPAETKAAPEPESVGPAQAILEASITSVSELPPPTAATPKTSDPANTAAPEKADELTYGFAFAVTPEEQAKALSENKEQLGTTYACVDVRATKAYFGTLDSIAGYRVGSNGDSGYVGKIGVTVPGKPCPEGELFGQENVGVTFPADAAPRVKSEQCPHLGTQGLTNLKAILQISSPNEVVNFVSGVANPYDDVILAIGDTLTGQEVFCFVKTQDGYRAASFEVKDGDSGYGFPLDFFPGNRLSNRFSFLPDFNGDGRGEILVTAGETRILAPPKADATTSGLTTLRLFHLGMHE